MTGMNYLKMEISSVKPKLVVGSYYSNMIHRIKIVK